MRDPVSVTRDDQGRLLSATSKHMELRVDPVRASATYRARDGTGSERWADGRVRGTWLDLPYAHENDVDEAIDLDAWLARSLRQMRGAIFFSTRAVSLARLRAIWRYVEEHAVLHRSVTDLAARSWAHDLARALATSKKTRAELTRLVAFLERPEARDLLASAREGAGDAGAHAFVDVAIADSAAEKRARAHAAKLVKRLAKASGDEVVDASAPDLVRTLNNLADGLVRERDPKARSVLDAGGAIILARLPGDAHAGPSPLAYAAVADEYYWRVHCAADRWHALDYAAGERSARRAFVLEDLLDAWSRDKRVTVSEPFSSSGGAWAFFSILAEIGGPLDGRARVAAKRRPGSCAGEARDRFAMMLGDDERLRRRARNHSSLEGAFVAGFYATWKNPESERGDWRTLFSIARAAVKTLTHPRWAEWTAFLWMQSDDVDATHKALLRARALGVDPRAVTRDPDWAPFLRRHDLRRARAWRALLPGESDGVDDVDDADDVADG